MNGTLNLKFTPEEIIDIESGRFSAPEVLCWKLENLDCTFIGETYCLSNWAMGHTIYSYYDDCVYILNWADVEEILMDGKVLRLYADTPDEYDHELLVREGI